MKKRKPINQIDSLLKTLIDRYTYNGYFGPHSELTHITISLGKGNYFG